MGKIKRFAVGIILALTACLVAVGASGCMQKGYREEPGHECSWSVVSVSKATCESNSVASMKCKCGATKEETIFGTQLSHEWIEIAGVPATCLRPGYEKLKKCVNGCGRTEGFGEQIPQLPHDTNYDETDVRNYKGSKPANCQQGAYCGVCKTYYGDPLKDHHANLVVMAAKPATCEEEGWTQYVKCLGNPAEGVTCSYSTIEIIPALDHDRVVQATCVTLAHCGRCNKDLADEGYAPHNEIYEANKNGYCGSKPAVCGVSAKYCGVCEQYYGGVPQHDLEHFEAQKATCTTAGWNTYDRCKNPGCGYTTREDIEALGHDEVPIDAIAPGCETTGWTAGSQCLNCYQIIIEPKALAALGHDDGDREGNIGFVSDKSYTPDCTHRGYCGICKKYYGEGEVMGDHSIIIVPAQAATCKASGWYEYKKCAYCDYSTYEANIIPKADHFLEYFERIEPTCTQPGREAGMACMYCSLANLPEIPALGHDGQREGQTSCENEESYLPTCTKKGYCAICDTYYSKTPAGHEFDGNECILCGKKKSED